MGQIRSLTGLRGVAALWVVALHYTAGAGWTGTGFWFDLAAVGNAGVIVFFILSGYIMSHVYGSQFPGYGSFMWARFARVYPLHFATLIAFGIIAQRYAQMHPDDGLYTFFLNVVLVQAWGFSDHASWNAPSWTISIEFFCYLLFPFVALVLARSRVWLAAVVLAVSLCFVAVVPYADFLRAVGLQMTNPYSYGFYAVHFAWMFLAGMALQRVAQWLQDWAPQIGFDVLFVAGMVIILANAAPPLFDWKIAIGTALVIAGLSTDRGTGRILFGNPVVFFLGEISYALYLTHGMFRMVLAFNAPAVPLPLVALLAILFAAPVYYLFERPARALVRGFHLPEASRRPQRDELSDCRGKD
ncbi:acyltransferase family protein [Bradyrhizobium liaoningense]